ncbi:pyruvate kinase alpha/beta domain-containing protein, partial [Listeria monocytogenes]|uniref:pyruvate kinase alpha/beta domain-containing protein n=1 Tax=Listeria monocytogenes TaxID=1639 RepID=UPI000AD65BC8
TEEVLVAQDKFALKLHENTDLTEAIGQAVGHTAKYLNVQTIVAATQSGLTARMISKYLPKSHIVAVTFNEHVYRGLAFSWGVYPRLATPVSNTDEMLDLAEKESLASDVAKQ